MEPMKLSCETLISIFTIDKGEVKVLLQRKKTDPYKGYWTLIGKNLEDGETLESNMNEAVLKESGLSNIHIEQVHTFCDVNQQEKVQLLSTSFVGLVDSKTVELKLNKEEDLKWFPIGEVPKMGYNQESILNYAIDYLKKQIVNSNILKILYPSDFTLPELQRAYEQILEISVDRRNFRKKFLALGLIEDTGYKNEGFAGRPAKLYRFQEQLKETTLF